MTVIQKTVQVPESRRIAVDIPPDVPAGATASIVVTIAPPEGKDKAETILSLVGAFADSSTFAGDSVALVRKIRDEW